MNTLTLRGITSKKFTFLLWYCELPQITLFSLHLDVLSASCFHTIIDYHIHNNI
jgi:hypothetical protein